MEERDKNKDMLDRKLYKIIIDALNRECFIKYPESFSNRIIVQKTLYLLTHGRTTPKLTLPYKWNFYLRGPYSSEIAQMLYYMNDFSMILKEDEPQYVLNVLNEEEIKAIEHFKEFKEFVEKFKKTNKTNKTNSNVDSEINDEELYEMFATIVYISDQVGNNLSMIKQKFNEFKPELKSKINDEEFKIILNKLSEFGYI
ncbi:hypothetical protein [Candidatus Harpocratesius sp.]